MAENEKSRDHSKPSGEAEKTQPSAPDRQVKNRQAWYSEGLRFECTQCGACCSGEPGYVWVDEAEIAAMANEMKMSVDAIEH